MAALNLPNRRKKAKESCLSRLAKAKSCVYLLLINSGTRTLVQSVSKVKLDPV